MRRSFFLGVGVSIVVSAGPTGALAESVVAPDTSTCGSASVEATPASGEIPANLPRITVSALASLLLIPRGSTESVGVEVSFHPSGSILRVLEPLVVGQSYELVRADCPGLPPLATYEVVADATLPSALGTLSASALTSYYAPPGVDRYTFTDVTLARDPSVEPWLDAYDWWLDANGTALSARSLRSTTVRVDVACSPGATVALSATGHAAAVPYDTPTLSTAELTMSLACDDAIVVDPATEEPLTAAEIAERDRIALTDAASSDPDAGMAIGVDAGSADGGSATMPTEPDTNGNCSASAGRASGGWSILATALLILVGRARRRR